jgi:hypothetical protein
VIIQGATPSLHIDYKHVHTRLLMPGLAQLAGPDPPAATALRTAARNNSRALDQLSQEAGLAA